MSLIPISISSYNAFRADALARAAQGLGYDVDNYLGYQCWDLTAELWMHIAEFEDGNLWPKTGPNLYAEECWTVSRTQNAGTSFDLITNVTELKRGDIIVIGPSLISSTGHIAFCDEDYSGFMMNLLGQNQVEPSPTVGHIPTVTNLNISSFLGGFRFHDWQQPEPPSSVQGRNRLPLIMLSTGLLGNNTI